MQKVGSVTETADSNGEFTNGNVAQGVPPTILLAEIFNTWQRELVNIVEGSGMELDPNDFGQLLKAINRSVGGGRLLNIKTFSFNGTYTPTQGTKNILVKVWGGGGGGGNTDVAGAGGPSGSGGGYAEGLFDVPTAPVSVTVGTGGADVAANTAGSGGNGGASSFGSLINCGGGTGGTTASNTIPGGSATGGNVMNSPGQGGQGGVAGLGGTGGGSFGSFGGLPHNSSNGDNGGFPGGGGAGGTKVSSTKYFASGRGASGYVIVTEYA
ncbi:phage tail protein [Serratia fonticola]|uniref:glycine-rich domain-containing protein n=1 Tax=Serratia fonticola TaxID=47917 RepID=UPI001AE7DE67|nr:phage tail protein [Serratia fonticola]MBP0996643.1 phage tail protein [Serratia fonticola]